MKKVLVPIANGTEEMEVVIIVDILRRSGAEVIFAGIDNLCKCSRNIVIKPDILIDDIDINDKFDLIVLPGGAIGVKNLSESKRLKDIIYNNFDKSKIAAICAAPLILKEFGLIKREMIITSHPSIAASFAECDYSENDIVIFDNIITSRGAGTALDFSLKLVEILFDKHLSDKIANDIVYQGT